MPIPFLKHILTSLLALITLSATAVNLQPYKFNGKEHDAVHGLDLLDYGARMYDNKTGRWTALPNMHKYTFCPKVINYCRNKKRLFSFREVPDYVERSGTSRHVIWHFTKNGVKQPFSEGKMLFVLLCINLAIYAIDALTYAYL